MNSERRCLAGLPEFTSNEVVLLPDGRHIVRFRDRDIVVRIAGDTVVYDKDEDYVFVQERKAAVEGLLDGRTWQGRRGPLVEFYQNTGLESGNH